MKSARRSVHRGRAFVACEQVWLERLERRLLWATVPGGFVDTQLAASINSPTALDVAPDGRVFITTQEGKILILKNDA